MTDLGQLPASTISAFGGIIKDLLSTDLAKMAVFLIFCLLAYWLKQNTAETKDNSEENKKTRIALNEHAQKMIILEANMKNSFADVSKTIEKTKNEMKFEIERMRGIVSTVQQVTEQKLSLIPKVEQALASIQQQTDTNTRNNQLIIEGLKALKRRGGPL